MCFSKIYCMRNKRIQKKFISRCLFALFLVIFFCVVVYQFVTNKKQVNEIKLISVVPEVVINTVPNHKNINLTYLVIVPVSIDEVKLRKSVRSTWAKFLFINILQDLTNTRRMQKQKKINKAYGPPSVGQRFNQLVFVLGKSQLTHKTSLQKWSDLQQEANNTSDILLLNNLEDNQANQAQKLILAYKWAVTQYPNTQYFIKAEANVFVNFPLLAATLRSARLDDSSKSFIAGGLLRNVTPIRLDRSWGALSEVYKDDIFPDYLHGHFYIMSRSAIKKLVSLGLRQMSIAYERNKHLLQNRLPPPPPLIDWRMTPGKLRQGFRLGVGREPVEFHLEDVALTGMLAGEAEIAKVNLPGIYNLNDCVECFNDNRLGKSRQCKLLALPLSCYLRSPDVMEFFWSAVVNLIDEELRAKNNSCATVSLD